MPMMTYATVETILAGMFRAEGDAQSKAFRGRLKHLKRLGIPLGFNPGKGAKREYTAEYIAQMALCLQLAEFGLDPTAVVEFVKANWNNLKTGFQTATKGDQAGGDLYLMLYPSLMSSAWSSAPQLEHEWRNAEMLKQGPLIPRPRTMVINISATVRGLALAKRHIEEKRNG